MQPTRRKNLDSEVHVVIHKKIQPLTHSSKSARLPHFLNFIEIKGRIRDLVLGNECVNCLRL